MGVGVELAEDPVPEGSDLRGVAAGVRIDEPVIVAVAASQFERLVKPAERHIVAIEFRHQDRDALASDRRPSFEGLGAEPASWNARPGPDRPRPQRETTRTTRDLEGR